MEIRLCSCSSPHMVEDVLFDPLLNQRWVTCLPGGICIILNCMAEVCILRMSKVWVVKPSKIQVSDKKYLSHFWIVSK